MDLLNALSNYLNNNSKAYENQYKASHEDLAFSSACRRVITCLVNEKLVTSTLVKIRQSSSNTSDSLWVVLENERNAEMKVYIPFVSRITAKNIISDNERETFRYLDPGDLGQLIIVSHVKDQLKQLTIVSEISQILALLADAENKSTISDIVHEIINSIRHQVLAYRHRLSFKPLWRPPIEYEQSITVGHATHPMNKSRVPMHEMKFDAELYDFKRIKIYFYKVCKASMNIYGGYEQAIQTVAKTLKISYNPNAETLIPVHELQRDVINSHFGTLQLEEVTSMSALSECSLRTVNIDGISEYAFKISLGLKISSAMRTITHWSAYAGPNIHDVIEEIIETSKYLTYLNEVGSIIVKSHDYNKSKLFACIIRENVTVKLCDPTETAIVCAYLTEMSNEEYNITQLFYLKSQQDKDEFSDLYAKLLIDSLFDFVYKFGFSFEAHQQNVLLRVKRNPLHGFELNGFIVRDFGGIMVHQETLYSKIGKRVAVLDSNASILAVRVEDVYKLCYHTLFHCHLQQIFRSLGTHENGRGWQFVREHLNTKTDFLASEGCVSFFFGKLAPYKCFITMKLNQLEREDLYTNVPNLINF